MYVPVRIVPVLRLRIIESQLHIILVAGFPELPYDILAVGSLRELLTEYGEVALIWFDTPMGTTKEESQEMVDLVKSLQPNPEYGYFHPAHARKPPVRC